jgi:OFA family oxalate/formate antiporter-like MFS transporter
MDIRWRTAGSAVLTHVCLGSVYAWSIFIPALQAQTGWSKPQLTWAFSLAIACLGLTAALAAPRMHRRGPRWAVGLSAAFFSVGVMGAGVAIQLHSLWLLYGFYGVIGGIGLGLGYVPPVTALMSWFADRKGFATGLAVGGFGLGALLASFLGEWLLQRFTCAQTFLLLGLSYGIVILLASRSLRLPDEVPLTSSTPLPNANILTDVRFWVLWALFFVNIATGILLIALARPMIEESSKGGTLVTAVTAVATMGLFNGLGRLGWSSLSDHLGRTRTWMLMFLVQSLLFFLLRNGVSPLILAVGLWCIASCYGGGFALCPALVADTFGTSRAPRIYGLALTAWSAAALISPPLAARMREATGSYASILGFCATASLAGWGLVVVLRLMQKSSMDCLEASVSLSQTTAGH